MKKSKVAILAVLAFLLLSSPVFAENSTTSARTAGPVRGEIKKAIKEELREATTGARKTIKNKIARISGATVSASNGDSLTILSSGKTIIVDISTETKLRRKFWGNATVSEISVGDIINVWGTWVDEGQTTINAQLVRDTSIQKRNGVFVGTVASTTVSGWVINTFNRGTQTVTVTSSSKIVDRTGKTIPLSRVAIGNIIRVRGMWDNKVNTITEVATVKDYSLPPHTITPTSTGSATPE